jgi:ubiquinol-cytochrome c reductase cytochrome b subunit
LFTDLDLDLDFILYQSSLKLLSSSSKLTRIKADRRIGPHNKLILDIIFGSLLGDGHAERRIKGNGTRITFYQEAIHVSYLL